MSDRLSPMKVSAYGSILCTFRYSSERWNLALEDTGFGIKPGMKQLNTTNVVVCMGMLLLSHA